MVLGRSRLKLQSTRTEAQEIVRQTEKNGFRMHARSSFLSVYAVRMFACSPSGFVYITGFLLIIPEAKHNELWLPQERQTGPASGCGVCERCVYNLLESELEFGML